MSDDGTGAGIRIPAVMIGKSDGQTFIDYFKKYSSTFGGPEILLNVHFTSPKPAFKPKVVFWYTSNDARSLVLMKSLNEYLEPILPILDFIPQTVSWSCPQCEETYKAKNCLNDGQYCAFVTSSIEQEYGKDILMEDLRQHCIATSSAALGADKFLKYIKFVHELCPQGRISDKCSQLGLKMIKLPA